MAARASQWHTPIAVMSMVVVATLTLRPGQRAGAAPGAATTGATNPAQPAPTRTTPASNDYAELARTLYFVGACGEGDPAAATRPRAMRAHCQSMQEKYRAYKRAWADKAAPFFAQLRPAGLPPTVIYPFGGGDLVSALVVFPDATEITTISLEAPGDIRRVANLSAAQWRSDLSTVGHDIGRLFRSAHSTTKSLQAAAYAQLPGTIMFALAGLAVHDMEPVSLRYFDLETDGRIRYLSDEELNARMSAFAAATPKKKKRDRHFWLEQDSVFDKVEIGFRPRNQPQAPVRYFRHMVMNLDDNHLSADPRILVHLRAKGKVAAMTKAASFLLWYDEFSQIRTYLLDHIVWMATDASGLPPSHAQKAGLRQTTYGEFTAPYFDKDTKEVKREFVKMWRTQPKRPLPFRFGYPDLEKHNHLLITEREAARTP